MPFGDNEKPFVHQCQGGYNLKSRHFKFFLKDIHSTTLDRMPQNNKHVDNYERTYKVPVICMFGETPDDHSVMVFVHNYFPYFYIATNPHVLERDMNAVLELLKNDARLIVRGEFLGKLKPFWRTPFYGYTTEKRLYIKITYTKPYLHDAIRGVLEEKFKVQNGFYNYVNQFYSDHNVALNKSVYLNRFRYDERPKAEFNGIDFLTGLPRVQPGSRPTSCDYELHCSSDDIFNKKLLPHFVEHVYVDPRCDHPALHIHWLNRKNQDPENPVIEYDDFDSDSEAVLERDPNRSQIDLDASQILRAVADLESRGIRVNMQALAEKNEEEGIKEEDEKVNQEPRNGAKESTKSPSPILQEQKSPENRSDEEDHSQPLFAAGENDLLSQSIYLPDSENEEDKKKPVPSDLDRERRKSQDLPTEIDSLRIASQREMSESEEDRSIAENWDSEGDDFWEEELESSDSEKIIGEMSKKGEEEESNDSEKIIGGAKKEEVEEAGPSSSISSIPTVSSRRKHLKILEEKPKRATFLESSSEEDSDESNHSADLFARDSDSSSKNSCEDDFNESFDEEYYETL